MKRLNQTTILIFALIALIGCKYNKEQHAYPKIEFGNPIEEDISKRIRCRFIPLSTDSVLLGHIDIIRFIDNRIFILDRKRTNSLYIFDESGDFIKKISSIGQGPEEYSMLSNFFIDEKNRKLVLADYNKSFLKYFDLHTYKYLYSEKFDFFTDCMPIGDDKWAWFMPRGFTTPKRKSYYLKITSNKDETISLLNEAYFTSPHVINPNNHFHQYKDNTFIHFPFSDTVWKIENDSTYIAYSVAFGNKQMPTLSYMKKIGKDKRDYTGELFRSGYVYTYNILETDDYIQITYMCDKKTYIGFYNKTKKIAKTYEFPEFIKSSGLTGFQGVIGTYDNNFICYINPEVLKRNHTNNKDLQEIATNLKEDDNPIICIFKY